MALSGTLGGEIFISYSSCSYQKCQSQFGKGLSKNDSHKISIPNKSECSSAGSATFHLLNLNCCAKKKKTRRPSETARGH